MAEKDGLIRINVRLPEQVKNWYMEESTSLGMSMSQLMSYLLVTHYRNQEAISSMKTLTAMANDPEVKKDNQEAMEFMKSSEFKELLKEYQKEVASNRQERRRLK